jgi:UDP-N-acetylmuramyl pentapeptide phosphotransferase/UDP-N-acetylglucosamine-1-phosphate transferase
MPTLESPPLRAAAPSLRRAAAGAAIVLPASLLLALVASPGSGALFLGAAAVAFALAPLAGALARRLGAVALPGGRGIHLVATPSLGGLALLPPLVALLAWRGASGSGKSLGLLAAVLLVAAAGFKDDAWRLRPVVLGPLEVPFVLFWVVLVTNAVNLIDGLDGFASSIALMSLGALAIVGPDVPLPVVLGGALAGFLPHNLPRARIFLGDTGSLVLGVVLAALALDLPAPSNFALAAGILAFPLGDLALTVLRRTIRGKPLFAADMSHVHHKAVRYLGRAPVALLCLVGFASFPVVTALARPGLLSLGVAAGSWFGLALALVLAGEYRLEPVLAARRSIRRIHLVRHYVSGRLELARSRDEVESVLRHMVEALELGGLEWGDVVIPGAGRTDHGSFRIPLAQGRARWSGPRLAGDRVLEAERQAVLADLVREADERLRVVNGASPGAGQ